MARTPKPIRRLTAAQLGVEPSGTDSLANERGAAPPETGMPTRRIPEQVDAPIITSIADYRLIRIPGRFIEQTAPITGVSQYLLHQFSLVISDIEGQASKRVLEDFRQSEALLHDWSISKLLAFGTHLYLVESHADELKHELLEDATRRLNALLHSSRVFINSFEEWREYVEQSSLLDARFSENRKDIISIAEDAAENLARGKESVDPQIPSALTEYANTASRGVNQRSIAININSVLRSISNISVSFIDYITKIAKDGYIAVSENERAMKLLGVICDFFPTVMRLAATNPSLSWMLACSDIIRTACEKRGKSRQAR